jgi:hypothetical protein
MVVEAVVVVVVEAVDGAVVEVVPVPAQLLLPLFPLRTRLR